MFHVSPSRLTCRLLYILGEFSENKFTFACPHAGANRPDALGELVSDAAVDERALFFHFTAIDAVFLFLKTIYKTYRCRAFVPANRGSIEGRPRAGARARGTVFRGSSSRCPLVHSRVRQCVAS